MVGSELVDVGRVAPKLYVGSFPPAGRYRWVSMIVFCAYELQPPGERYPDVVIVRARLDDDPRRPLRPNEIAIADSASKLVAAALKREERVLVTCAMGLNRSALVAALAMQKAYGTSAADAIAAVRAARGPQAFCNPQFVSFLEAQNVAA